MEELVPRESKAPAQRSPIENLTSQQLRAIELLVQGKRPGAVAKNVGVARETLWRWRQAEVFKAHLTRLRSELHVARVDRIWTLTDKAYDVVEEHLNEGDSQVAIAVLRLAGGRLTDSGEEGARPSE